MLILIVQIDSKNALLNEWKTEEKWHFDERFPNVKVYHRLVSSMFNSANKYLLTKEEDERYVSNPEITIKH